MCLEMKNKIVIIDPHFTKYYEEDLKDDEQNRLIQ
jgi:hypothetical protein